MVRESCWSNQNLFEALLHFINIISDDEKSVVKYEPAIWHQTLYSLSHEHKYSHLLGGLVFESRREGHFCQEISSLVDHLIIAGLIALSDHQLSILPKLSRSFTANTKNQFTGRELCLIRALARDFSEQINAAA